MKELKPSLEPGGSAASYQFGPFVLDVQKGRLSRHGEIVSLTRKALDTLTVLVSRAGEVVEKEDLLRQVWPDTFVTEDTLTQNISTLRKALGDTADVPEYIATVPRRGYRFVGVVTPLAGDGKRAAPGAAWSGRLRERIWMSMTAISTAAALILAAAVLPREEPAAEEPLRFTVGLPRGTSLASGGALSPDGRWLTFVARNESGRRLLMLRAVDSLDPVPLPGTEGADRPFWSPDSRNIGFFAERRLKQIALAGGSPMVLAETGRSPQGGTWNRDGVIVYSPGRFSGLYRVSASGGTATPLTRLQAETRESGHWWPQFLPDGERFLFSVESVDADRAGLYLGTLGSEDTRRVLPGWAAGAVYAWPGYLLFVRDRNLMAQPFDAAAARISGVPALLAADVPPPEAVAGPRVSASESGLLAYIAGSERSRLTWFDRSGPLSGPVLTSADLRSPDLSDDERFVIGARLEMGRSHLWLLDLERDVISRVTARDSVGELAVWSPDGRFIAYSSDRGGSLDLYVKSTEAAGEGDLALEGPRPKRIFDWSPDGRFLVYGVVEASGRADLWLLPVDGDRRPVPYLSTPFDEIQAQVAPNSRWLAYASDESGSWQVYVRSFPTPGQAHRVSIDGGAQPRWRGDGRELYYLAPDGRLMAVPVRDPETLHLGKPEALFRVVALPGALDSYRNYYVAMSDGQRFLVDTVRDSNDAIAVIRSWSSLLRP